MLESSENVQVPLFFLYSLQTLHRPGPLVFFPLFSAPSLRAKTTFPAFPSQVETLSSDPSYCDLPPGDLGGWVMMLSSLLGIITPGCWSFSCKFCGVHFVLLIYLLIFKVWKLLIG